MFGAKLSWCQIVRCQIVLVPNCPGAKLSANMGGAKLSRHHGEEGDFLGRGGWLAVIYAVAHPTIIELVGYIFLHMHNG